MTRYRDVGSLKDARWQPPRYSSQRNRIGARLQMSSIMCAKARAEFFTVRKTSPTNTAKFFPVSTVIPILGLLRFRLSCQRLSAIGQRLFGSHLKCSAIRIVRAKLPVILEAWLPRFPIGCFKIPVRNGINRAHHYFCSWGFGDFSVVRRSSHPLSAAFLWGTKQNDCESGIQAA